MAATLKPYLDTISRTLEAVLCLQNFESPLVERHNKPEVEIKACKDALLNPIIISRNEKERVLIEGSINSARVSISIKQSDDLERMLCKRLTSVMMRRSDDLSIIRRKPIPKFDISFLITNDHIEQIGKQKIIDFILNFMRDVDRHVSELKLSVNSRARTCAEEFFKEEQA